GWDQNAVERAARNHAAKEAQADKAKAEAREADRASRHERYLAETKKPKFGPSAASPVGRYTIDSEEIGSNWPDLARDMTLAIRATPTAGIYQADFDFGVIEGIMMLSYDERILDRLVARAARQECDSTSDVSEDDDDDSGIVGDDDDDDDDDSQNESSDENLAAGSKRKATASKGKATSGRYPKKAKVASAGQPEKSFVRLRLRDSGTGQIHYMVEKGTIKFNGPNLGSFTGEVDISGIGKGVIFEGQKISAVPPKTRDSWENYSEAAYDRARVGRWQ
ncbi:hypothetical protein C8A03DRAFT_17286, partial [Achaetomium macrosporum]